MAILRHVAREMRSDLRPESCNRQGRVGCCRCPVTRFHENCKSSTLSRLDGDGQEYPSYCQHRMKSRAYSFLPGTAVPDRFALRTL